MLEPAAGRGHLSFELRRAGLEVASFDLHRYANPLVPDIEKGDIRRLTTLEGFEWVVTNLPYGDLEELATHLIAVALKTAFIEMGTRKIRITGGEPLVRRDIMGLFRSLSNRLCPISRNVSASRQSSSCGARQQGADCCGQ